MPKGMGIEEKLLANIESSKQKKQNLFDKLRIRASQNDEHRIEDVEVINKETNDIEIKFKKEIKKLESKLEDAREQNSISNKKNTDLLNDNKKIKTEVFELKSDIKSLELVLTNTESNLKEKILALETQNHQLSLELNNKKKNVAVSKEDLKSMSDSRASIKSNYDQVNAELQKERHGKGMLGDQIAKLNTKVRNYSLKIIEVEKENKRLIENSDNIDLMILNFSKIITKISTKQLQQLQDLITKKQTKLEQQKIGPKIAKVNKIVDNIKMGNIVVENAILMFRDLEGKLYKLSGLLLDIEPDVPVKANIESGLAEILQVYKYNPNNKVEYIVKKKKLVTTTARIKTDFKQFGAYNVLIVGSRNKLSYLNRLKLHGIDAVWHDPFEESEKRLASKYATADIVLVCEQHICHTVWDIIDKQSSKVESLKKDSIHSIVARMFFASEKLKSN